MQPQVNPASVAATSGKRAPQTGAAGDTDMQGGRMLSPIISPDLPRSDSQADLKLMWGTAGYPEGAFREMVAALPTKQDLQVNALSKELHDLCQKMDTGRAGNRARHFYYLYRCPPHYPGDLTPDLSPPTYLCPPTVQRWGEP